MTYGAVDIVGNVFGLDTAIAGALTDEQLEKLFSTPFASGPMAGRYPEFLWGYVPLPGNAPSRWDMTGARLRVIADMTNGAGTPVKGLLVQHCRSGAWVASAGQGAADGAHAAEYAAAQDYPDDCHLAPDDEDLKNPGPNAIAHFTAWCAQWRTPCLYEGYAPGMTPEQEYELPDVSAYWGAYGPWGVATRGVRCRQLLQIVHAGVQVDPDHAMPDAMGGVLRGFGRLS